MGGECFKGSTFKYSVFSAYSKRSAASSKANDKGLNLSKAAGWSNAKTFAIFYKKTISENFGEAILKA